MGESETTAVTRRMLLQRTGMAAAAVGLPTLLAACGSSGGTGGTATVNPGSGAPRANGTIDFLGYEGDDLPDILKQFKRRNDVKLKAAYISAESEIQSRILGGGGQGVDLMSVTSPYSGDLINSGVLATIDPTRIPNMANLWPFFEQYGKGTLLDADGNWKAVPFYWGSIGLAWDSSVVPKSDVTKWTDILNPAFTGKVAMLDVPDLAVFAACAALDLEPNQLTEDGLARVKAWLTPVVAQVKTFTTSFGDLISLLGSKEVAALFPGFPFLAGAAQAQGNKQAVANIQLEEGVPVVIEAYAIGPKADNVDAAYAWINEALAPRVNAAIASLQGAATSVDNAVKYVDPAVRKIYPYANLEEYYKTSKVVIAPPRTSTEYATEQDISDMWAELKKASKG